MVRHKNIMIDTAHALEAVEEVGEEGGDRAGDSGDRRYYRRSDSTSPFSKSKEREGERDVPHLD